ncbi:hypothetical protein VYU27_000001 [Nannochloropsis oceanica]
MLCVGATTVTAHRGIPGQAVPPHSTAFTPGLMAASWTCAGSRHGSPCSNSPSSDTNPSFSRSSSTSTGSSSSSSSSSSSRRMAMSVNHRKPPRKPHRGHHPIQGFREEPLHHIPPPSPSSSRPPTSSSSSLRIPHIAASIPPSKLASAASASASSPFGALHPMPVAAASSSVLTPGAHAQGAQPSFKLPSQTVEWQRLVKHATEIKALHLRHLIQDPVRSEALCAEYDGMYFDYSRQQMTVETRALLIDLAKRAQVAEKIAAMARGDKINHTEGRAALHMATRAGREESIVLDGVDVVAQVHGVLDKVKAFSEGVRAGTIRGATGKKIRNIVAVGIGGSYLGPACIHEVFKTEEEGSSSCRDFRLRFLSNVDPVDVARAQEKLDPEETLVIVVSKSFVTAETMLNARTMRQWLWDGMGKDPEVCAKHMAACASASATHLVEEFGIPSHRLFEFWDWVGGRYSVCASPGALPISLKFGYEVFEKFLAGARSMDRHFLTAPFERNLPVLMGLLGVWNMSFLGYKCRTIIPYAEAMMKFPAHIQQVDMESNGKHVTVDGEEINYEIGEIDFGEPGTNGQHSFFQLLHMGQVVPVDFIGFAESQKALHVVGEELSSHDELMCNFFAQPDALAIGKTSAELLADGVLPQHVPHRTFKGNRPSLSLLLPRLNAYSMGQLLALYEHRTAVQGFVWHVNSFDQWGVELGKQLATHVRDEMKLARSGKAANLHALVPATARILQRYWAGGGSGGGKEEKVAVEQEKEGKQHH